MARTKQVARQSASQKRQGDVARFDGSVSPGKHHSEAKRPRLAEVSGNKLLDVPSYQKGKLFHLHKHDDRPKIIPHALSSNKPATNSSTPISRLETSEGKCIWVKKGTIAQTQVDVIVNTTCPELVLDRGAVSTAILALAGPHIQDECDLVVGRSYGDNQLQVPMGQFRTTGAGKLPKCKMIYHAVCPQYDMPNSQQILSSLIYNLLIEAHWAGMSSIAFPSIGTGDLGFPANCVASIICQQIVQFSRQFPDSNLRDLRLVIHWNDEHIYQAFQRELGICNRQQLNSSTKSKKIKASSVSALTSGCTTKPKPNCSEIDIITISGETVQATPIIIIDDSQESTSSSSPSTVIMQQTVSGTAVKYKDLETHRWGTTSMWMESVSIQVGKGDLTKETTDAIVVQTSEDLDLTGRMATAVLNKGGPNVALQCRWLKKNLQGPLTVTSTEAGELQCEDIIFVALTDSSLVKKRIIEVLEFAERKGITSLAIPALGTGELGSLPHQSASDLLDGIGEFIATTKPTSVDRIKLTILEAHMLEDFKSVFSKKIGHCYGYWKGNERSLLPTSSIPRHKSVCSYEEEEYCRKDLPYDSELMGNMDKARLKKVQACAAKYKVNMTALPHGQRHVKSFRLEGRRLDVLSAKSDIQELYLTLQKQYNEQKQAHKVCQDVQWKWLDKDDGKFIDYDIDTTADIEKAYKEGRPFVEPPQLGRFRIDLLAMKEINLGAGVPVRETSIMRIAKTQDLQSDLPNTWTKMNTNENLKIVDLPRCSSEFLSVYRTFLSSLGFFQAPSSVMQIQRIQNKELYRQYHARKDNMESSLKGVVENVEQTLFHGTTANSCDAINRRGFNRSYSGLKRGTNAYGEGTYFAKYASYSANGYSAPDTKGHKRMYMCKVLTGDYTEGKQRMMLLPSKPGNPGEIYDSLVDNVQRPEIFVIFHDAQAYPEYLITFC